MPQKQSIELPAIKHGTGFSTSPDFVLIFKSNKQLNAWTQEVKALPFAQEYYLLEGHIIQAVIEPPEPPVAAPKPAPASTSKSQSFTISQGKMTRPF
jgi:hypothetical protein